MGLALTGLIFLCVDIAKGNRNAFKHFPGRYRGLGLRVVGC